ncbi:MAG TPA: beta-N-acetylhexosaminidase [Bryobacteraceae bacterium]
MSWVRIVLVPFALLSASGAEHRPLLPQPQEVHYGSGSCAVRKLAVRIQANASDEDRFAARELARFLSESSSERVEVVDAGSAAPALTLTRTGGVDALPVPGEQPGPESREAYWLTIGANGGELRANSSAGLYYGVQTIRQLIEGSGEAAALPYVTIHDWPSLAYRGTMIDMSHGPLPKEEEIRRQIDFLARWKANQYYFYTEASIELDGYPLLNPEGRFTKEQVRRIVQYGRERHVDVVPFLELYGHLHDLLRIEQYSGLGAFPHAGEVNPSNPKVGELMADWAGQIADLFPSPFVHIGFDETWQIEMVARNAGGGTAPAKLFTRQLTYVTQLFQKRGKTVMAWADIVVKYPGIIEQLPKGLIPVAWDYDAMPDIKKWLDPLVAAKLPHFIQSGVANWKEIVLDFDLTFSNIDNFLAAGRRSKAMGLINSVWLDSSQAMLRVSLPAIAYGSVAPWQSTPMDRQHFFSEYSEQMYAPAASKAVAGGLDGLNRAEVTIQKVLGQDCYYEMWESPFSAKSLKRSAEHREQLRQARLLAEGAQVQFYEALRSGAPPATIASLVLGARMIDYAGYKFLNVLEIAERWRDVSQDFNVDRFWNEFESEVPYQSHGRLADMMDAITQLREAYRNAWLAEYTPYRLATTLGRFDAEYAYWRRLQSRFRNAANNIGDTKALPPLESVVADQ